MKICIITGTFHPEPGGPGTYLYNLAYSLLEKGYQITVITYGEKYSEYVYPYPVIRISRRYPVIIRLLLFIWQILKIGGKHDLLYVNDYGVPPLIANFFLRKPVAMKFVGDFAWEYSIRRGLIPMNENIDEFQGKNHSWKIQLIKKIQSFYGRKADLVITPSHYFKSIVAGWGVSGKKIRVIYNSIDLEKYSLYGVSQKEARQKLGLDGDGNIILTIARLAPWKGIDKLIEILPQIKKRYPEAHLVVVGDGEDLKRLEEIAIEREVKNSVIFTGRVSRDEIPYFLRSADVFVLYSGYEGLPHVILEAMAAGLPIVASNKGGIPELIHDGLNGILVPLGDLNGLEAAICKLLSNKELSQQFAIVSKEKITSFSWDTLVSETVRVFDDVTTLNPPIPDFGR